MSVNWNGWDQVSSLGDRLSYGHFDHRGFIGN
jgi:hypothetical protein